MNRNLLKPRSQWKITAREQGEGKERQWKAAKPQTQAGTHRAREKL
jgi:hypothetical protein